MASQHLRLAGEYFTGQFDSKSQPDIAAQDPLFDKRARQFLTNYDDWYHGHYARYGSKVDSVVAVVKTAITVFKETFGNMPLCYKNCAISSGTNPHLDAVIYGHHTSDKLARVVGAQKHTWQNVMDNSLRSLAMAHKVHGLMPHVYMVTPSAFEGSTRVFSNGKGWKLTGGLPLDAADYMAFWNMVIDSCEAFVLDDPKADMPDAEQLAKEIELARKWSDETRNRKPIITSDWANSRNSILEIARGTYIRFGLHPLRPDAKMDVQVYDEETDTVHPATLLECTKPVVQNILRWAPQGIATEEACRTVARFFNLHRMRTDPDYNASQDVPLETGKLDPVIKDPSQKEIHEFNKLIKEFEPFLLKYCAHLIKPEGLPDNYASAREEFPVKQEDIGEETVKWQRANIQVDEVKRLWEFTLPGPYEPEQASKRRSPLSGDYKPQRRKHDYLRSPFEIVDEKEIWQDRPFNGLDEMTQDLASIVVGVLETGILPPDSPDYNGVRFDLKRGAIALEKAKELAVRDMASLPGVMGKQFTKEVGEPTLQLANEVIEGLRIKEVGNKKIPAVAFGTPQVKTINETIRLMRDKFAGPGPASPPSEFRLAVEMEMLRRNYTHITFQKGWETSEDSARMMLQATKVELDKVKRPGENHTELAVLDEEGNYISLYERYEKMRSYLNELKNNPDISSHIASRDAEALKDLGVRHIALSLARIVETYDCLIDPLFNQGRFELQKVENQKEFTKDMHSIQQTKFETVQDLLDNWVWLWNDKDFEGLRQDYRDAWLEVHGRMARNTGPAVTDDNAVTHRYGPI
jgi:hypothetical protein